MAAALPLRRRPRAARALALVPLLLPVLLLGGLLTGCANVFENREARPCPPVRLEASTAELTRFRPGPGRDLTDVVLEAELAGFQGECQYLDDDAEDATTAARVDLVLDMTAALGPAAEGRRQDIRYFVAIPRFYPAPAGKQVFETSILFPEGTDRVRYVGEEVSVTVPMAAGESALDYPIYIGFQLTADQVEFNRAQRPGGR
ncbi:hypothetical protein [Roseospira goensis]|uniref:Uncharacterized protein n=1 Tax=Roseospira goensis TaxID=391922 RepID=A0A7W6RYD6_9PROT|nr:hypothetical protein [Roseospira goensis]MBB4285427.1 hypothetical protein [Roseospira goensis]